ncbi:MAG: low temperature requirement protein [Gaiellaceae bacterium]|nr:low temperature requirement protein [Gaiellaceae bacterium]
MEAAPVASEPRVTPLELFFDLVFVFALTQVTAMLAADLTWPGLLRGLLVLGALWWAWAAYAWLTNEVSGEDGRARLVVFGAMAAMILVALAVPEAFDEHALLFALAYLVVRFAHLGLFWVGSDDEGVHGAVLRLVPSATVGPLLLVTAALADGPVQGGLWLLALAIDYAGPYVRGVSGWRLHPAHFAERFGLIVIIALGESIVAIGIGAADETITLSLGVAAVLGVAAACALWWAYFDVVAVVAERKLTEAQGDARTELARDSYAYLHLPMIAGIVLFALGLKSTLAHLHEPLEAVAVAGLCGGVALYLVAHVLFRLRNVHTLSRPRLVTAALAVATVPLALETTALTALAVVTALCAGLIAYETIRYREARRRVRLALSRR